MEGLHRFFQSSLSFVLLVLMGSAALNSLDLVFMDFNLLTSKADSEIHLDYFGTDRAALASCRCGSSRYLRFESHCWC